jgi:hypothetical protein
VRRYGESIALEGDTLVVGDEGAVHVFGRNRKTNTWSHHTRLSGSETFGPAVALSSNTLAVGGSRTFVFERKRAAGEWQQQAQLDPGSRFGQPVALAGNTLVVAEYHETQLPHVKTGAVYVFERDPARGGWSEQAKLVPRGARVGNGLLLRQASQSTSSLPKSLLASTNPMDCL